MRRIVLPSLRSAGGLCHRRDAGTADRPPRRLSPASGQSRLRADREASRARRRGAASGSWMRPGSSGRSCSRSATASPTSARGCADPDRLTREENDWTSAEVAKNAPRLIGFCSANPLRPAALQELERCLGAARHDRDQAPPRQRRHHACAIPPISRGCRRCSRSRSGCARRCSCTCARAAAANYGAEDARLFLSTGRSDGARHRDRRRSPRRLRPRIPASERRGDGGVRRGGGAQGSADAQPLLRRRDERHATRSRPPTPRSSRSASGRSACAQCCTDPISARPAAASAGVGDLPDQAAADGGGAAADREQPDPLRAVGVGRSLRTAS